MAASLFPSGSKSGVLLAAAFGWLVAPALAAADIYTWTDEKGTTVISDTPPANPKRVADLQVVVRDNAKSGKRSGAREATPTEQKLLDRIDRLERQANGQTYSAPPVAAPMPPAGVSYYTTPPPAPAYYDPYAYDPYAYYPSYYPSYYPGYSYVLPGAVIAGRGFFRGRGNIGHRPVVTPHRSGVAMARGGFRR